MLWYEGPAGDNRTTRGEKARYYYDLFMSMMKNSGDGRGGEYTPGLSEGNAVWRYI